MMDNIQLMRSDFFKKEKQLDERYYKNKAFLTLYKNYILFFLLQNGQVNAFNQLINIAELDLFPVLEFKENKQTDEIMSGHYKQPLTLFSASCRRKNQTTAPLRPCLNLNTVLKL